LKGLLGPWVAAVLQPSENGSGTKKNKHFIGVIGSCYAGAFVEAVRELRSGLWRENNCSVTLQSSCAENEEAFGEISSLFVYVQDRSNLRALKTAFRALRDRFDISRRKLPMPQITSTNGETKKFVSHKQS
jgi:hypothetical protein